MSSHITTSLTFIQSDEYAEKISRVSDIILEDLSAKGYFDERYRTEIYEKS